MHILIVHQAFTTVSEPGGTRHHEMARYFCREGHRVTVLTGQVSYLTGRGTVGRRWLKREADDAGVEILRIHTYQGWHRSFFHRVLGFITFMLSSFLVGLKVRDVDLIWGTIPPLFQGITAWILARLKGAVFLLEVRDLWPYFAVALGVLTNPIFIRLSEGLEKLLYRRADCVVINSPGYENHVRERGAKDVHLVPNGVDTSMFDPSDRGEKFLKVHGLLGKFVVLYAGAHGLSNDLEILLQAADSLRDKEEIQFVLVGDGKEKEKLVAQSKTLKLENVHFLPSYPKMEMPKVLASAQACIAILKPLDAFKTTYPNKVFDYMAAGRPVILAIDGVIRQVVEEAKAGIFVQPGYSDGMAQAILKLEQDRGMARRMGLAGHHYVEKYFDRSFLSAKMMGVMMECMEKKRR
ncbi:MAG: glycosyltransferase WbuB [Chloroflexi bacterium RBG_16_48_8]|nr:MAG: glycosyltransferase WbuB [Chloroflexi bacterium RBG_16_48_8]